MKRHTNKNIKSFGLGLIVLALLAVGAVSFCLPSWAAETKKQEVDVKFTFNPTISLTVSEETIEISGLSAGTAGESKPVTVSVATNNANGYYLSATAGTKEGNTDLVSKAGNGKFTHLDSSASSELTAMKDNTWGVAYAESGSDIAASKFKGLPLDGADNGATGTRLLEASSAADNKSVQVKVGAKAGATLPAGTYTNKINFYAVSK